MKASQIRDKYKQILEQPQSQNSEDQWEIAYSQMARQRKKKIMTQSTPIKIPFSQHNQNHQNILSIKEKLAQSIANNKQQLKQIQKYKYMQIQIQEERKQMEQKTQQFKRLMQQQRLKHQQKDHKMQILQHQIQALQAKIAQISMDRQLQQKQSEYYKIQLDKYENNLQAKEKELRYIDKEIKMIQKIKKENQYLKNDVQRLSFLIQDTLSFGKINKELMKKHFLGKPGKEFQYWFSQELIGEVQHFLKKQQIGYGNKEFTSNLVKFIDKFSKIRPQRSKTVCCSKPKEKMSLKKPSKIVMNNPSHKRNNFDPFSLREEITLKSNTNSLWKNHDSLRYETLTSHPSCSKSLCWDIITQFKSIVFQLLLQKEVKRKKIKKLIDIMCNQIMKSFDYQTNGHQLKDLGNSMEKNQFMSIKIQRKDQTQPLKYKR